LTTAAAAHALQPRLAVGEYARHEAEIALDGRSRGRTKHLLPSAALRHGTPDSCDDLIQFFLDSCLRHGLFGGREAPRVERVSCLRWKNFGLMPTNVWTGLEPPERKESARFSCRWPGRGLRPLPGARMRRSSPRLLTCAMTKTKRNQVRAR
jgi:hypothetical protein